MVWYHTLKEILSMVSPIIHSAPKAIGQHRSPKLVNNIYVCAHIHIEDAMLRLRVCVTTPGKPFLLILFPEVGLFP